MTQISRMRGLYWTPDTSVRDGLFAARLHDQDTDRVMVQVIQSTNTFAKPNEYDFNIYTEEGVNIRIQSTSWAAFKVVLVKLFVEHDLAQLELPPHKIEPIQHEWR